MELLSPAGNLETALAAFDGGADAVYCGLGRFNARERAENFTPESLGKLLEYARSNGKKVYLTLNTLVWEKELGNLRKLRNRQPHILILRLKRYLLRQAKCQRLLELWPIKPKAYRWQQGERLPD